jgi:glycosidase
LVVVLFVAACGSTGDPTTPVPNHPFDPGVGGGGSYGSGSGGGGDGTGNPPGPPMCDDSLKRCPHTFTWPAMGNEKSVTLIGDFAPDGWTNGVAMTLQGSSWTATVPVPYSGKVTYKFHIVHNDNSSSYLPDPNNPVQVDDGFGGKNSILTTTACVEYTCASTQISCPGGAQGGYDWRDAVLYYVFVDRFANGNPQNDMPYSGGNVLPSTNWQGGDWAGLLAKIQAGYFQTLGVNALWLTVPMEQSQAAGQGVTDSHFYTAYHGYWPSDLTKVEPHFGTQADLQAVVNAAHTAGMKVLLDYSMHHVHTDSPLWAMHQSDGWFHPLNVQGGQCLCDSVPGSVCSYDGPTGTQCWFAPYLPTFDFTNAGARSFSVGNAVGWLKTLGADGFRLDAVKQIDQQWILDLRTALTSQVEPTSKQHVYLVGETFSGDPNTVKGYVDPCNKLDGQFDFPLRATANAVLLMRQNSMKTLIDFMNGNDGTYGQGVMSTFLGNADVPRSIHFAEDSPLWSDPWASGKDRNFSGQPGQPGGTSAYERMALGYALLFTNRGIPLVYYGDEIGLAGAGDPDNRRFMTFPSGSLAAGQQLIYGKLQKLGALRAGHSALRRGTRATLSWTNDTWAYSMTDGSDVVYVAMNRSDQAQSVGGLPSKALKDEMTGDSLSGPTVSVPPRSFRIFIGP